MNDRRLVSSISTGAWIDGCMPCIFTSFSTVFGHIRTPAGPLTNVTVAKQ